MRPQDLSADVEAEAQAPVVVRRHGPFEPIEDPRLILVAQADAVVADRDPGDLGRRLQPHLDRTPGAELDRVGEEIREHLLHTRAIPGPVHLPGYGDVEGASSPLAVGRHAGRRIEHDLRDVHLLGDHRHPPPAHVGDVEEAVDETGEPLPLRLGGLDPAQLGFRVQPFSFGAPPKPRQMEEQGGQRRPQLVRSDGEEGVSRLDGLERFGQQGAVLQGDRGPARQILGQDHVVAVVTMGIGRGHHHQDGVDTGPAADRNAQGGSHSELPDDGEMLRIARAGD